MEYMKYIIVLTSLYLTIYAKQVTFETSLLNLPEQQSIFQTIEKKEITLPDLHGNTLKLFNALIAVGMIQTNVKTYDQFVSLYFKQVRDINKNDITMFKNLLVDCIIEVNNITLLRLIGDELCDRGNNDLWTILLLQHLQEKGLSLEFILSNHSFDYLLGIEEKRFYPQTLNSIQGISFSNLGELIELKSADANEIINWTISHYIPSLKLISYTQKDNNLSIYTHAPSGLGEIRELAEYFDVNYNDSSLERIKKTIDGINTAFVCSINENGIRSFYETPIMDFFWNRNYRYLNRPKKYLGYNLEFIHGHDSGEKSKGNIFNLDYDNNLGKSPDLIKGKHQFFVK